MRHHHRNLDSNGRLIAGIIILTAGLLFLFNNLNILPSNVEHYIFDWKTLLIAIGTLNLLFSHNRTAGLILITVGVVFWIPDILEDVINIQIHARRFIWPMAIIAVGLFIMFKRPDGGSGLRFWEDKFKNRNEENETEAGQSNFMEEDYIDNVAIFGGGERVVTSKNFKGGKLTAIFGGSEIRLHHAKLAPGNQVLDVFFMFGGSGIIVPADWTINVDVVSIFGGFTDKRFGQKPSETEEGKQSVLTIRGFVLFGGGELKSY